jgi:uncharacterized membrane protein YjjP (DUF1212 family)
LQHDRPGGADGARQDADQALAAVTRVLRLLFANGQTTEQTVEAAKRVAASYGTDAEVIPDWGHVVIHLGRDGARSPSIVAAAPTGIDMRKVAATARLVDAGAIRAPDGKLSADLRAIEEMPPISVLRFATMAAVGAMALAVIFGARELALIAIIGISAFGGGLIRRWLAHVSTNLFVPPLCAALLAGIAAAFTIALGLDGPQRLAAVCPCMVLVPGPHILNGAIDLVRARVPLGLARLTYAMLVVLAICTGLLMGLALGRAELPVGGSSVTVPLAVDIIAAGCAVAAYGTFFSMPWRTIPVPVAIGMLSHASRWFLLVEMHASAAGAAFGACLIAGTLATVASHRLRVPFAALAFASVVSLIPGVLLFRMAAGVSAVAIHGSLAEPGLLGSAFADGASAFLILLAMTLGLIAPRMLLTLSADATPQGGDRLRKLR